jgi:hypothetical protein
MDETPNLTAEDLTRCEVKVRVMRDGLYHDAWVPVIDIVALVSAELRRAVDRLSLTPPSSTPKHS